MTDAPRPHDVSARLAGAVGTDDDEGGDESTTTVVIAFAANALIAVAKTFAAMLTGSASMVAEAVHSWADTGNEVFLLIAGRRSRRPANADHPLGHGREAYVWSMFAAIGLFAIGAGVSITHGIQELVHPEPATDYGVAYAVLALAFLLEGFSFLQAVRQTRAEAARGERELLKHVLRTSDPTVRAVFAEDAAALIGLVVAFVGIVLHQVTGSPVPDAIGSIVVGLVLGVVAVVLIDRNRRFLVGQGVEPRTRSLVLERLLDAPVVERVTYLRIEFVGPRSLYVVAAVDIVGDEVESDVARTLARLERAIVAEKAIVGCVLTLSAPEDVSLAP
ncbi:cation diffusion facilitator family transporter [Sediminihabitans luteus]|uniref:Cation diffusion facilitator family transporter n=1 Tax=Sediminihabitans luteus TaxID=1138585 RepID=A0A2M9D0J5_9CELL|nr:cation transporter [Sediminihabitans luteus]PJJ77680.1 cation diffusion facilitator family transporter [Sediminihabitans luteus]GIJ00093.1 cation diffusion facilitator transporter [Sediminihabitans luteus]